ncbi:MAG: zinc ribbon domain-containing protein [Deltaproteobacteria bacterium]|nr:zinc ribbon domain-containing protein [Deltaproteobacteria bacterium]
MPIYEYQCAACGQVVEKWQKVSEDPLSTCPACGGSLSKLISNCSFHLKGSGWYVTDYSGSRSGAASSSAAEASKPADATDSAQKSSEAKPAEPAAPAKKFK